MNNDGKSKATKNDNGKAPMHLIPPEAEIAEAFVWGFGAKIHGAHNFRNGLAYSRVISSLKRHTNAIMRGEDYDSDPNCEGCINKDCKAHTGQLHAACIRACAGMLIVYHSDNRTDLDDRYKKESK